jgi:hypothetical protein
MCIGKNTRKLCCQLEARIRNLRKHFSYQECAEQHFWQERRINDAPFSFPHLCHDDRGLHDGLTCAGEQSEIDVPDPGIFQSRVLA